MSLFQKSVTNKYLKNLDNDKVEKAFENFKKFYGNKLRLANIMQLKEENYQEGFLREIFVETLGYIINPDENYNLTTEFKNQKDARKADGAILNWKQGVPTPCAVIELKSTKTKDLESIKEQAFGYKNNQPDCKYVITSNFQKLRFYIDNATDYEEFNLFEMASTKACNSSFRLFYLLLSKESIFSDLPEKLKEETKFHENNISAKLYEDYKHFKDKIFENLLKNNPQYDKLTLFKKSQKLLDRFLFIFFAEDSGLIPPNAVSKIVEQWKDLQELDEYKTLYSRFQKLFTHLDKGHIYKKWGEIPAYNGGLFRDDEILDSSDIIIDDEVLEKDSLKLSAYDFNSEVDVNILGHIFEHSLNEIEEITAEISAARGHVPLTKKVSKRKKDGVFYTPKYITKYIVENTVGTLCNEKKEKLQINNLLIDETYYKKGGKISEKGKKLFKTLNDYKDWLLTLKILDPACGSGAFLNQTLDFLIAEHKLADDLIAELTGDAIRMYDTDKSILENNIFGVDINEESVEIAKLSLWLRTAQRGRPLSNLSNNIKCGNSLIDDPEVAGNKAFNWNIEFPQVFKEKVKKHYHITWVTHNSRTSQRMIDYKVKKGDAVWLDEKAELKITEIIKNIVIENNINVLNYNICGDHIHILLVCEKEELSNIVRILKGKSSQKYKEFLQIPKEEKFTLWAQKYNISYIETDKKLNAVIEYISNNRIKHNLPMTTAVWYNGLQPLVQEMCCSSEHAFRTEYKGGFDVVIGNPPYGAKISKNDIKYLLSKHEKYGLSKVLSDTYIAFYIQSLETQLKNNGLLGFITPNTWRLVKSGNEFRNFLSKSNYKLQEIIQHKEKVFTDATVDCDTLLIKKQNPNKHILKVQIKNNFETILSHNISQSILSKQDFFNLFLTQDIYNLKQKIEDKSVFVKDNLIIKNGVKPYEKGKGKPPQTAEIMKEKPFTSEKKIDETFLPLIGGSSFHRYKILWNNDYWIKYGKWLAAPRDIEIFTAPEKLIFRQTGDSIIGSFVDNKFIMRNNTHILLPKNNDFNLKYVLAVLNSKLSNFIYWTINPEKGEALAEVKAFHLGLLCFPKINTKNQQPFIEKANLMLSLNKELQTKAEKFIKRIKSNLEIAKITKKLQTFYNFDFTTFLKEINKQRKSANKGTRPLALREQDEWEDYFDSYKTEINDLQRKINQTDKEIDKMVYELYELTEEEIEILENSVK